MNLVCKKTMKIVERITRKTQIFLVQFVMFLNGPVVDTVEWISISLSWLMSFLWVLSWCTHHFTILYRIDRMKLAMLWKRRVSSYFKPFNWMYLHSQSWCSVQDSNTIPYTSNANALATLLPSSNSHSVV